MKRFLPHKVPESLPVRVVLIAFCCSILIIPSCLAQDSVRTDISEYQPGQTVPDGVLERYGADMFFSCTGIPDSIFREMQGRSYKPECTVPRDSLRYIRCLHRDAEGKALVGEMVLNVRIADDVLDIFRQLFFADYPIECMRLTDLWDGDDERSMRANNTSGFNWRPVTGTSRPSRHALGLAVDINPLYNPSRRTLPDGTVLVEPSTGTPFVNRSSDFNYKIVSDDLCCRLFRLHGFRWGGDWRSLKDYQHFEKP